MSDELSIEGKTYISSKRASSVSGYAQDYIGQLARGGLIEARRIGGLWYIGMESLEIYKKSAENFKPEPPTRQDAQEPGTLVFFDGKEYCSAARAAELTGYAQDYVGQLARAGAILSRQVGNRWYVEKQSVLDHKREKDALLAAVQTESVGLSRVQKPRESRPEYQADIRYSGSGPFLTYLKEDSDLIPLAKKAEDDRGPLRMGPWVEEDSQKEPEGMVQTIPIRRVRYEPSKYSALAGIAAKEAPRGVSAKKNRAILLLAGTAATIVIVLSVGYESVLKKDALYASNVAHFGGTESVAASAEAVLGKIGNILEPLLTHELNYERPSTQ